MAETRTVAQTYHRAMRAIALELPEPVFRDFTAVVRAHVAALEELVYSPGDWICPTCGFVQSQRTLHVASGQIGTSEEPPLPCPNDGQFMERLTWKQMAKGLQEIGEGLLKRAVAAERDTARVDFLGKHYEAIAAGRLPDDFVVADEEGYVAIHARGVPIREAVDDAMTRPYFGGDGK